MRWPTQLRRVQCDFQQAAATLAIIAQQASWIAAHDIIAHSSRLTAPARSASNACSESQRVPVSFWRCQRSRLRLEARSQGAGPQCGYVLVVVSAPQKLVLFMPWDKHSTECRVLRRCATGLSRPPYPKSKPAACGRFQENKSPFSGLFGGQLVTPPSSSQPDLVKALHPQASPFPLACFFLPS